MSTSTLTRGGRFLGIMVVTVFIMFSFGCPLINSIFALIFQNTSYAEAYQNAQNEVGDTTDLHLEGTLPSTSQALQPNMPIFLFFDDLVNPDTIDGNILVSVDDILATTGSVNLILSLWNGSTTPKAQVAILPVGGWEVGKAISIEILDGLEDNAGNSFEMLPGQVEITFTTSSTSTVQYSETSYSFEDGDDSVFMIQGRGGLVDFSDADIAADVDFSGIDGNYAVLLSTGNEAHDYLLPWSGLSGNAIPAYITEPTKNLSRTEREYGMMSKDTPMPGDEPPPMSSGTEYSSFLFSNLVIPSGARFLQLDYYFISDEFKEYIGSMFDDVTTIAVADNDGHFVSDVIENINKYEDASLQSSLVELPDFPDSVSGGGGDVFKGSSTGSPSQDLPAKTYDSYQTYRTPLNTITIDISAMQAAINLLVTIADVGDNYYNSYIVFDAIRFVDTIDD